MIPMIVGGNWAQLAGGVVGGLANIGGLNAAQARIQKAAKRIRAESKEGYEEALGFQTPFIEQGERMVDWFKKYTGDPQLKYEMYSQYAKEGDPLYDYYQKKQSEALNRQLAARGRFGGGYAMEAHAEAESALSAKMAHLTDTRVARELQTRFNLMTSGQAASNIGTQLRETYTDRLNKASYWEGGSLAKIATARGEEMGDILRGVGSTMAGTIRSVMEYGFNPETGYVADQTGRIGWQPSIPEAPASPPIVTAGKPSVPGQPPMVEPPATITVKPTPPPQRVAKPAPRPAPKPRPTPPPAVITPPDIPAIPEPGGYVSPGEPMLLDPSMGTEGYRKTEQGYGYVIGAGYEPPGVQLGGAEGSW